MIDLGDLTLVFKELTSPGNKRGRGREEKIIIIGAIVVRRKNGLNGDELDHFGEDTGLSTVFNKLVCP